MDVNDFKLYSAKVGQGSGVLFQPMNKRDYTYILTANHNLFEEKDNDRGITEILLLKTIDVFIPKHHEIEPIKIDLTNNENYFPHIEADIAILRIDYIEGYESIFTNSSYTTLSDSFVCGFPTYNKENIAIENKFTSYELRRYIDETGFFCKAQLTSETKEQSEIGGLSGGGIMRIEHDVISLIGIQSEVSSQVPNGQIEFVPIRFFDDIINYSENEGKLSFLMPPYMGAFTYLVDEIIKLEEAINPSLVGKIKSAFNEQIKFIGLTPLSIYKSKFSQKLLVDLSSSPYSKKLWVSWLEYLTILSFIDNKEINIENVEELFNHKRLVHSDTESSWLEIIPEILRNCLVDIEENASLIISTNHSPSTKRRFKNDVIPNICSGHRSLGVLQIDQANRIRSLKEIIHIKAFENDCILESQSSFDEISELEIQSIIDELKVKINEFFES
jgi:hypothetical protein